jgi:hypothetical protein
MRLPLLIGIWGSCEDYNHLSPDNPGNVGADLLRPELWIAATFGILERRMKKLLITLLLKRSTPFTLTAVFASGEESPHSDAYVLLDWGPKPRIIRLESR